MVVMVYILYALFFTTVIQADTTLPELKTLSVRVYHKLDKTVLNLNEGFYNAYNLTTPQTRKIHLAGRKLYQDTLKKFHGQELILRIQRLKTDATVTNIEMKLQQCIAEEKSPIMDAFVYLRNCIKSSTNDGSFLNVMIMLYNKANYLLKTTAKQFYNCIKMYDLNYSYSCVKDIEKDINVMSSELIPLTLKQISEISAIMNDMPWVINKCYHGFPFSSLKGKTLLVPEMEKCILNKV